MTGVVKLFYTGSELDYDRIIVKETKQSFDHFSNPIISGFLSGVSNIELSLATHGIHNISVAFLKFKPECNIVNENEIHKTGILSEFFDVDEIYIEGFYKIDKSMSSNDMLFLDKPVSQLGPLYSVKTATTCVSYLTPIKDKIVEKVLNLKGCDKKDREWITDTLLKIDLIRMEIDCKKRIELYKSIAQ